MCNIGAETLFVFICQSSTVCPKYVVVCLDSAKLKNDFNLHWGFPEFNLQNNKTSFVYLVHTKFNTSKAH